MTNINKKVKELNKINLKIEELNKSITDDSSKEVETLKKLRKLEEDKRLCEKLLNSINYLYIHKTVDDPYIKLKKSPAIKKDGVYISKY